MCLSTPNYSVQQAAPLPAAMPTVQTSTASDAANAMLSQYTAASRRRGLGSTVRNEGGTAGIQSSSGSGGLATAGSAQYLGQGA